MERITILCGSPHKGGSCDYIIKFLDKTIQGYKTETIFVRSLNIKSCQGCHSCEINGKCIIDNDDMYFISRKLTSRSHIIVVTPVYFYNVPSVFKNLIDRCQIFWAKRYKLGEKKEEKRTGMLISVAGCNQMKIFSGVEKTIKYFFDALNVDLKIKLYLPGIEFKDALLKKMKKVELKVRDFLDLL